MSHETATTTLTTTLPIRQSAMSLMCAWRLNRGTEWLARGPGLIFTRFGLELQSYLCQSSSEAENGFVYSMLDQTQGFAHMPASSD